jgi:phenylpropionate dioxygenase-like ring-hydroxylating dioxygenase large terminal subunit
MTSTIDRSRTSSPTLGNGLSTGPIPISGMVSQDYYEREIERIWKRTWLLIGRTTMIPNGGDFFVKPLPFAKTSALVTRDKRGEVRAFHNICSHRCNKLVWANSGNTRLMRCGFHGWVYDLDGSLVNVPDEENFFSLDKAALGLTPIAVDVWEGFVFVNLAPEPPESLPEFLGPLHGALAGFPFDELTHEYQLVGEVNCNYKIARDAFLETYHLSTLHKESLAKSMVAAGNPFGHSLYYGAHKYHSQFSIAANPDYKPTPMELVAAELGAGMGSATVYGGQLDMPPGINPTRSPNWSADNFSLFPNSIISPFVGSALLLWHSFWPLGVDKCLWEFRTIVRPPQTPTQRWVQEVNNVTTHVIALEDMRTMEQSQEVIASGAKNHMQLQDHEFALRVSHHWNQQIAGPYPKEWTR